MLHYMELVEVEEVLIMEQEQTPEAMAQPES